MKICPVCKALAFDDATTCFGCMHPFGPVSTGASGRGYSAAGAAVKPAPAVQEKQNRDAVAASRFVITLEPALKDGQTVWSCSVEQPADQLVSA